VRRVAEEGKGVRDDGEAGVEREQRVNEEGGGSGHGRQGGDNKERLQGARAGGPRAEVRGNGIAPRPPRREPAPACGRLDATMTCGGTFHSAAATCTSFEGSAGRTRVRAGIGVAVAGREREAIKQAGTV
jgi:hypothetical protein